MNRKVDWFSRGRDAFTEGLTGFCDDGRISGKDRADWHCGFEHQKSLNSPQASEEELRQTAEVWTQLCNELFP